MTSSVSLFERYSILTAIEFLLFRSTALEKSNSMIDDAAIYAYLIAINTVSVSVSSFEEEEHLFRPFAF